MDNHVRHKLADRSLETGRSIALVVGSLGRVKRSSEGIDCMGLTSWPDAS